MTWNYRVIRHEGNPSEGVYYGIHEVFYDEDSGKPVAYSEQPLATGEDLEELHLVLDRMQEAVAKDILEMKDFPGG